MADKLEIAEFIKDFREGVKDADLREKHSLSPRQMTQVVKKLVSEGHIKKEHYLSRNRKIEEADAKQEKEFLKSLYGCPTCGHLHPTPFIRCPACGNEVPEHKDLKGRGKDPARISSLKPRRETAEAVPAGDAGASKSAARGAPATEAKQHGSSPLTAVGVAAPHGDLLESVKKMVGMGLENTSLLHEASGRLAKEDYRIAKVLGAGPTGAVFKAESSHKKLPAIRVKLFHDSVAEGADVNKILNRIIEYQSNMDDPNILKIVGSAILGGRKALLYEYAPLSMEAVLEDEPEGLPLDAIARLLPQVLNGVGYSHMHRGRDGVARRLPHLSLKPSQLLLDADMNVVKLDDCGVSRAFIDVRGYKKRLWEEPGPDMAGLAPETFVLDSKYVNAMSVDIYALGAVLYRLVTGKAPFSCSTVDEYQFAHLKKFAVPPRVHRYTIPSWLDEMIMKCLEKDPDNRWRSATQMELAIGSKMSG